MLSKRHKTKLKELAHRIKNTQEIYEVTLETVNDATAEIEELLTKFDGSIKRVNTTSTELAVLSSFEDFEDIFKDILNDPSYKENKNENFSNDKTEQQQQADIPEPKIDSALIPSWAKKLRRGISKKCHPDIVDGMNIPQYEKELRREYLLRVNEAIEKQDWDLVLVIGVHLDVYCDELPPMNQKRRIQKVFQRTNKDTVQLRETIAYKWSEEWNNLEFKYQVVELFLNKKGISIGSKVDVIKRIKEHETLLG